jgi:hypothetical protein
MSPTLLRILMERRRGITADPSPYRKHRLITEARKESLLFLELDTRQDEFVELDTRHNDGYTISLEWNRDTGNTQIVVCDIRTARQLVFSVPAVNAGDAFRHPFRYAP